MRPRLEACSFGYGKLSVLEGLNLEFGESRISAVLGPSGCGKTSLLRLLSGLDLPWSGRVELGGSGRIGMVFQEDRLLPWLTVRDNLRFALKPGVDPAGLDSMVDMAIESVGLGDFAKAKPAELSGGMRQRVAIARAFAKPSSLLLMDEAFRSLDLKRRDELSQLFLKLWARDRPTAIVVTHDLDEALTLAHRIIVFSDRPARILLDLAMAGDPVQRRGDSAEWIDAELQLKAVLREGEATARPSP